MGNWGRNPVVREMRDSFSQCPGCLRSREAVLSSGEEFGLEVNQCLTVDHLVPRSLGGSNCPSNLLVVCNRCNFIRGNQQMPGGGWRWDGQYSDGWPCPQEFYGRAGRANRRLWEQRSRWLACLLGAGPYSNEELGIDSSAE